MYFSVGAKASYDMLAHEIDEIFNAVERDTKDELVCHYDKDRFKFSTNLQNDWDTFFRVLKSSQSESAEGIDCYALGHNLVCVFHMSHVAQIGLWAVAREREIKNAREDEPLDSGTWGPVFPTIEARLKDIRKKPPGPKNDSALAFYDSIQKLY